LFDEHRALRFIVSWGALTFIFFEVMPTRLSHYVLPGGAKARAGLRTHLW